MNMNLSGHQIKKDRTFSDFNCYCIEKGNSSCYEVTIENWPMGEARNSLSLSHSKRWEISESRKDDANWSWEDSIPSYSYRNPKRFDLAIWYANSQLCGLCIGKPTFTGARLRLDVIEGSPLNHPLKGKVVSISISAAEAYADLIGADQIRIMRPLNKDLIRYYQNHGFTYRQGKASNTPSYLWRNL